MDLKNNSIQKIKEYFKMHKITGYENYVFSSIYTFRERDLLKIVDKIKENPNNAGVVQIFLHKTLEKYNFTDLSRDNYLTGFKNEEIHKYIDEWKEWLNYNERDLKNFQMLTNWIFPEEKFQEINKSHVDR